jgi:hypothetical protein
MLETKQTYMGENKTILKLAGELFTCVNVKVLAADVAVDENGKKLLKAGTVISKDGKIVDGTTITNDKAFGLVYATKDFTNSNGNEIVSVLIFGFVDEAAILPTVVPAAAKTAMKMVTFL